MTVDDPLIPSGRKLGTHVLRKLLTALVAVFVVLGFQPVNAQLPEPGLVEASTPQIDFLAKPIIPLTHITPLPKKKIVQVRGVGNGYVPGQCVWYVASLRPDLPRNLHSARTWLRNAEAQGLATGKQPTVGAVVVTSESRYGHVAEVLDMDEVSITVTEMNYVGPFIVSTRTIPRSSHSIRGYIY